MSSPQKLLIIGSVFPEPNSSAAGGRMMQLIALFIEEGWEVTFASAATDSDYMFDLETLGVDKVRIELNNKSFDSFISSLQPDMVMFDRFMIEEQYGWRVSEQCPTALRILDTEDLHCLRAARQAAFKENRFFDYDDLLSDVAKREVASILRCDLSLIISDFEMNLLQNYFKVDAALLHYLPFMLDPLTGKEVDALPTFESRSHFISIGNFLHAPNVNAVMYLKEEIWPLIRKELPAAELHIYGAYPPQKITQLHNVKEGFLVKGRVEDANLVVRNARVSLAPLRFGAGMKGKLVEAMLCGTPSVTTVIGAESMHRGMEWSGGIANDARGIATAAVNIYTIEKRWRKAQKNGFAIINTIFPRELLGARFIKQIMNLQRSIENHRKNNFIGEVLRHHSLSSTKYMSRWIEEKNKD